jgi:anti-sigma B factor antagonist
MNLIRRNVGSVSVLDLVGRLMSTDGSGLLKDAVDGLVADGRTHIVLNLSRLLYIDSGGLGEMLACHLTASKAGGAVTLAQTTARIQELLAITGLVTVFDTYETEQLALDSFASPAASGAMSRA